MRRGFVLSRLAQLGLLHGHEQANIRDNNRVEMRPAVFDTRKPLENLCIWRVESYRHLAGSSPALGSKFQLKTKDVTRV